MVELFNGIQFTLDMIFITILLIMQYLLGSRLKQKTKLLDNAIKQLVFYCLIVLMVVLLPALLIEYIDVLGIIIMYGSLAIGFGILNNSEIWYRTNMDSLGEHDVKLKFLNKKSESNLTNVYERFTHESKPIERILANNISLVLKMAKTEIFSEMVELFKAKHPEIKLQTKGKDEEEQLVDIFSIIYKGFYFHQVFFSFWFMDIETEMNSDIQALILSTKEKLPRDLILTCCKLQDDEIEGKKFSTIHGIEGLIDEDLAKRLNVYKGDFEFFKIFPSFFDIDEIIRDRDFYKTQFEILEKQYYEKIAEKLSIDARTDRINSYKKGKKE